MLCCGAQNCRVKYESQCQYKLSELCWQTTAWELSDASWFQTKAGNIPDNTLGGLMQTPRVELAVNRHKQHRSAEHASVSSRECNKGHVT